jgi:hypothetical protein
LKRACVAASLFVRRASVASPSGSKSLSRTVSKVPRAIARLVSASVGDIWGGLAQGVGFAEKTAPAKPLQHPDVDTLEHPDKLAVRRCGGGLETQPFGGLDVNAIEGQEMEVDVHIQAGPCPVHPGQSARVGLECAETPALECPPDAEQKKHDPRVIFRYDARKPGNLNSGHTFGAALSDDERSALVEYLKTI